MRRLNYIFFFLLAVSFILIVEAEAQKWPWSKEKPVIDRIQPSSGAPGIEVTITGRNFDSAKLPIEKISPVKFHTVPSITAKIVSWTNERIVVKVPPGRGIVNVTVGESNRSIFTYREPFISNMYPSSGKVGSDRCIPTTVTITGENFGFRQFTGDGTRLMFGQSVVTGDKIKEWNNKKIVFETPDDCGSGLRFLSDVSEFIGYAIKVHNALTFGSSQWAEYLSEFTNFAIEHKIQEVVMTAKRDGLETNVRIVTSAGESNKVKFIYPLEVTSAPPSSLPPAASLLFSWKASATWSGDFNGPRDSKGRRWFDPDFNDSNWTPITLPDNDSFYSHNPLDRFYRASFDLSNIEIIKLSFSSDDGVWIYVNGRYLGHWGGQWRKGGCVNSPLKRCVENINVQPVVIPSHLLFPCKNSIAVRVSNGGYNSYFDMRVEK